MKLIIAIRIKGKLDESGKYSFGDYLDYCDMMITREEADRIVQFLSSCLAQEDKDKKCMQ